MKLYRQLWRFDCGIATFPAAARHWRRRLVQTFPQLKIWFAQLRRLWLTNTTFIAVTGSCGKSTTTGLAAAMLATTGPCYRRGRENNFEASLKTLLSVGRSSKYCVQEVSGHRSGVIADHIRVLRPHVAIVTTIGSDHYSNFRSLEATAREKGHLVESLPRQGIAILNADDPNVRAMAARTRARIVTFGLSADADVRATGVLSLWPGRLTLTVVYGRDRVRVHTRFVGEHWTTSILAAIACGIVCGIDLRTCAAVLGTVDPEFGRYSIHPKPGGAIYVLDTQKAPSWTIPAGLKFVADAAAPRKTIVFGTISDYPGKAGRLYRRVAREALAVADRVVFVGPHSGHAAGLQSERDGRVFGFQTTYAASAFLAEAVLPEELIYIKASITDHLERIMLSLKVVCWREQCRIKETCPHCGSYRKPHAPPLRLAKRVFLPVSSHP